MGHYGSVEILLRPVHKKYSPEGARLNFMLAAKLVFKSLPHSTGFEGIQRSCRAAQTGTI